MLAFPPSQTILCARWSRFLLSLSSSRTLPLPPLSSSHRPPLLLFSSSPLRSPHPLSSQKNALARLAKKEEKAGGDKPAAGGEKKEEKKDDKKKDDKKKEGGEKKGGKDKKGKDKKAEEVVDPNADTSGLRLHTLNLLAKAENPKALPDDQYPEWIWELAEKDPSSRQLKLADFETMPLRFQKRLLKLEARHKIKKRNSGGAF
jgi:hypothetical protein